MKQPTVRGTGPGGGWEGGETRYVGRGPGDLAWSSWDICSPHSTQCGVGACGTQSVKITTEVMCQVGLGGLVPPEPMGGSDLPKAFSASESIKILPMSFRGEERKGFYNRQA